MTGRGIVIADAMHFFRQWLRGALRERGWQVVGETSDGGEVLRLVQERRAGLVLLDLHLPGKDGFAVLGEIQRHAPGVRAIVCSAAGRPDDVLRARRLGAADFLLKPVAEERLWAAVERVLGAPPAGEAGEAGGRTRPGAQATGGRDAHG